MRRSKGAIRTLPEISTCSRPSRRAGRRANTRSRQVRRMIWSFAGGVDQDVEHLLDPLIVRERERVVQHHHSGPPLVGEQLGEREAGEYGDLLARAVDLDLLRTARPRPAERPLRCGTLRRLRDRRPGTARPDRGGCGAPAGRRSAPWPRAPHRAARAGADPGLRPRRGNPGALALQLVEAAPGDRQTLVEPAARQRLNARAQPLDRQLALAQRGGAVLHCLPQLDNALLDRFERLVRRLLLQLAQMRLGARDLRVPHRAAGHEIGLRQRALDFGQLCPQLIETPFCLRAAINGLPVRGDVSWRAAVA